ncbi:MAG TPA: flagellar protein FlgN [Gammaproteobacteria bacterium]|nr:flagellar protein FlgN [Gammaproteobacteria bacterium]
MPVEGTQHPLETVLLQEVECTGQLLACLDTERSALAKRDLETLGKTTEAKLQHTRQLEQLEQQRAALLDELGFASDADSQQFCFDSLPCGASLTRLWQEILDNTRACRTHNLSNGGVLESSRQHVEQALCILRGQSGTPSLYDTSGGTATNLGQRELGKV